jgi:glycosyltransferase involved in cell wall biosynthesis
MEDIIHSDLSKDYQFEVFERSAGFPPGCEGFWKKNVFRFRRFLDFFRKVSRGRYALVHIHSADPAFLGTAIMMLLARAAGANILLHMQGTDWDWFYPDAPLFRKLYTRFGLYLPHTILVLYQLWLDNIKALGTRADVRILRNLIHKTTPPESEYIEQTRKKLDLSPDDFVVVTVGTVGWRKGSFDILKAVPLIASVEPSAKFVFVGGEEKPGEWNQLMEIVNRDKLEPWVRFMGEVDRKQVPVFLALGNVFLLPSYHEGMPVAILEAMRSGLAVVSTRVNAIPDVIETDVSGILINPGAPQEIADAIVRLKGNPDLCLKLAETAKHSFDERFEFSQGIDALRSIYSSIIPSADR